MGLVQRKDSRFWWMNLEQPGQRVIRESTKIPAVGAHHHQTVELRKAAEHLYNSRMADLARVRLQHHHGRLEAQREPKRERERRGEEWTYVYFVTDGEAIKIGKAVNVEDRLKTLRTAHHKPIKLLATALGLQTLEREIHEYFAQTKRHGEWFEPTSDLLAFIDAVKGGQHPVTLIHGTVAYTPIRRKLLKRLESTT